jgi:serine/threonine-protein kinase
MARKSKDRYELKEKLGEGGMGVVWQAYDTVLNADVALKMLLDVSDPSALKAFYDECNRLAALVHPNLIEIRDVGSIEDEGTRRPYLVMPLLRGKTLGDLMRESTHPISVERCIDIFTQACRGLQAAHDYGLLHRDIKPNNIFILDDDSVKIIDFGVAHRLDLTATVGRKGTLLYMSPEQLLLKPLSRASDVFSLAVVCYEAITKRHPFARSSEAAIADAVQHINPRSASSINLDVNRTLSQVLHKGMAKHPSHRFSSAKEFGELLRRAYYDSSFAVFDPAKFAPRLQKATDAFESGDFAFAQEMVNELESEGYLSTELEKLAENVRATVEKRDIERLLDSSRARMQDGEYRLALQRVNEALEINDRHPDALALKHDIEGRRAEADIIEWLRVGRQHLEKFSFLHARQAAERILELNPGEERAMHLLSQVERQKSEYHKVREQKNRVYAGALEAERQNDITAALSKMKQVLELDKQAPEIQEPGLSATFHSLYNKLHAEHEAIRASYDEARQALERGEYATAAKLCDSFLERYPQHTLFKALKFDNDQRWRRAVSTRIIQVEEDADREPDLDRRVSMLEIAVRSNPDIAEFERLLTVARDKRDLVNGIVTRARDCADREQYGEALVQWETLQTIHPAYIGLDFEIDNMRRRRQFAERVARRNQWVKEIDRAVEDPDLHEALRLLSLAKQDFPEDSELQEIENGVRRHQYVASEAEELIKAAQACLDEGSFSDGLSKLRQAHDLGSKVSQAKAALVDGLLRAARACHDDAKQAGAYLQEILSLEPGNPIAGGMLRFLDDQVENQRVDDSIFQARQLTTNTDYSGAVRLLEDAVRVYPNNSRLKEFLSEVEQGRHELRTHDLEVVRRKRLEADHANDAPTICHQMDAVRRIVDRYKDDEEFQEESRLLDARLQTLPNSASANHFPGEVTTVETHSISASPIASKQGAVPSSSRTRRPAHWIWMMGFASVLISIALGTWLLSGKPAPSLVAAGQHVRQTAPRSSPFGGTLVVRTNQAGADFTLMIEGKVVRRVFAARERIELTELPAGPYLVHAHKNGFEPPPDSAITIGSGRTKELSMQFKKLVEFNLHTLPGAVVSVDGKLSGTSDSNGNFSLADTPIGSHKVEVQRYDKSTALDVLVDDSNGSDHVTEVDLEKASGTVTIVLNPPGSSLTVTRMNGQIVPVSGTRFDLPEGQYRFTARASHFQDGLEVVSVPPKGAVTVDLSLKPAVITPVASAAPALQVDSSWVLDKQLGTLVHKSAGFGLVSVQPVYGTYAFTASLEKSHLLGKSKLEWVAAFVDARNYLLFFIDRDGFSSCTVHNGEREMHRTKLPLPKFSEYSIAIQVRPGRIITSVYDGKTWKLLEDWGNPSPSLDSGKFGFKDQITLHHLSFSKPN